MKVTSIICLLSLGTLVSARVYVDPAPRNKTRICGFCMDKEVRALVMQMDYEGGFVRRDIPTCDRSGSIECSAGCFHVRMTNGEFGEEIGNWKSCNIDLYKGPDGRDLRKAIIPKKYAHYYSHRSGMSYHFAFDSKDYSFVDASTDSPINKREHKVTDRVNFPIDISYTFLILFSCILLLMISLAIVITCVVMKWKNRSQIPQPASTVSTDVSPSAIEEFKEVRFFA